MDASGPLRARGLSLAAAAVLSACGGSDGAVFVSFTSGSGTSAEVASSASCLINQAMVRVEAIEISQGGGQDTVVTLPEPRAIDLLDPGTGVLEALQVPPLTADAMDVQLRVTGDGTVRLEGGTLAPLEVSDMLRLSGDFRLAAGMAADLVVQGFDRCGAIQAAAQPGRFVLRGEVPAQVRAVADPAR